MKKEHAHHGQRVHFLHSGVKRTGVITNMNKADEQQVDIGDVEPPVWNSITVTRRYADLSTEDHATAPISKPGGTDQSGDASGGAKPKPPTLDEIRGAGYTGEGVAEKIFAEEQEKFAKGYPPYGTNQPPAPKEEGRKGAQTTRTAP